MVLPPMNLDLTLGCGQVFRWFRKGDWWNGVLGESEISLRQTAAGVEMRGKVDEEHLLDYFRHDDDINSIYEEISVDPLISGLVRGYYGLRLIRQDPWECCLSYLLASNASFRRIQRMVENVCEKFGRKLPGGRYSFPQPEEIVEKQERAVECGLGYRCRWLVDLAYDVLEKRVDLDRLGRMNYTECVKNLKKIRGVGEKVADCIALFSLNHLEAFPVDVRIKQVMKECYGVDGSVRKIREFGQARFGRYAGYAQEFLYLWRGRSLSRDHTTDRPAPFLRPVSHRSG